jgi:RNA recognition motif-containing protein
MQEDSRGNSKGYCFVQYSDSHDARAAFDRMNGYELGGMNLRIELIQDDSGHVYKEKRVTTDRGPTNCLIVRNVFDAAE